MNTRALRPLALVAVSALLLAACGGSGDDEQAGTEGTSSSTSTTAAASDDGGASPETTAATDAGGSGDAGSGPADAGDTGDPGDPGDSGDTGDPGDTGSAGGSGGSGGSDGTNGSGGSGGSASADAPAPPEAGTYEYDTDGFREGGLGREDYPEVTTLEVDPPEGDTQRSVRDLRDEDGDGTVTETVLRLGDQGVFLEYLEIVNRQSGLTTTYEFRPDPARQVAHAQPAVGDHFEFTLESTDGGITVDVEVDVTGEERASTAEGTQVDTFVLRTHSEFSGDVEGESTSVNNVAKDSGLAIHEDVTTDVRFGTNEFHSEHTAVLRSLDPS